MKKPTLCTLAVIVIATFASCRKDYECHCQKTSNAGEDHVTISGSRRDAKQTCENVKTANPSLYSSCELN